MAKRAPKREARENNEQIIELCAEVYDDPWIFVKAFYQWNQGDLTGFKGPDRWQTQVLKYIADAVRERAFDGVNAVPPIRIAVTSGHGVGKSALTSWIINWIMSTRPYAKGVVTANTAPQLETKTWAELAKWTQRCLTRGWFDQTSSRGNMRLVHKQHPETWRCDAQTCREENSESFAGLHAANSSPFYLFDEACHDDQTEVMTDSGWKLFSEVTEADLLLTQDKGKAYYDKPTNLHIAHRKGKMLLREGRGSNFCVTPNHRMWFTTPKLGGAMKFAEAGSMAWSNKKSPRTIPWHDNHVEEFTIPEYRSARKVYPAKTVKMDDWCAFLGWYITEGSIQRQNGAPSLVSIAQREDANPENVAEIIGIAERMGYLCGTTFQSVIVYDPALANLLDSYGKGFADKRVPQEIKNLGVRQLNIFLDAAVKGDGYNKAPGKRDIIYTSGKRLADDYQEMILKTGCNSTVTKRSLEGEQKWILDHWATTSCDGYVVSRAFNGAYLDLDKAEPKEVDYDGMVYCATISGGVLLTRRNGVPLWSGNSAVPNVIWEVAEGGLTDGEPFIFVFGNPTRNSGKFFDCFNTQKHRWHTVKVDSRKAAMTNKKQIDEWVEDYGEDSDFVRVRVRGEFPRAGDSQFIPSDSVFEATQRELQLRDFADKPIVMGVDVARFGEDESVLVLRQGRKLVHVERHRGLDTMDVASKVVDLYKVHQNKLAAICVDGIGVGAGVVDRLKKLQLPVVDVVVSNTADDQKQYANLRAELWGLMKMWLNTADIPLDNDLFGQLTSIEYGFNNKMQMILEKKADVKKRGLPSPDVADALSLTFASSGLLLPRRYTGYRDFAIKSVAYGA